MNFSDAGPDIITSSGSTYVRAYYDGGFLKSMEGYSKKYVCNIQICNMVNLYPRS